MIANSCYFVAVVDGGRVSVCVCMFLFFELCWCKIICCLTFLDIVDLFALSFPFSTFCRLDL